MHQFSIGAQRELPGRMVLEASYIGSRTRKLPVSKRLQARFEAFNFFNTPWFGAPNTSVTSAAFGTVAPTQANDPRNIQLGIRLTF